MKIPAPGLQAHRSLRTRIALTLCAVLIAASASPLFSQTRTATRVVTTSSAPRASAKTRGNAPTKQLKANARGKLAGARNLSVTQANGEEPLEAFATGEEGIQITTSEIMARQRTSHTRTVNVRNLRKNLTEPNRRDHQAAPGALPLSQWPQPDASIPELSKTKGDLIPQAPQTPSTQFDGATTPTDTGGFPPIRWGRLAPRSSSSS